MSKTSKQCANLVASYNATGPAEQAEFKRKLLEIEGEIKRKRRPHPVLEVLFKDMDGEFGNTKLKEEGECLLTK